LNSTDDQFALDRAARGGHLAGSRFKKCRALQALSSTYVERQKLAEGAALSGAGKRRLRAGPLHYLLVAHSSARCLARQVIMS
jgi:hypothetical protein